MPLETVIHYSVNVRPITRNCSVIGSPVASDEKGLAISPAPCSVVFGPGLFSEPLPRPPGPAFPHSP